jgi:glycerophosphoryl diester phosphodiesterase
MHATGKDLFCSRTDRKDIESLRQRGGEKVPFLEEVIERFLPRIEINIEIKGNNYETDVVYPKGREVCRVSIEDIDPGVYSVRLWDKDGKILPEINGTKIAFIDL